MTREIALHCMKSYSEHHSDLCELCPIYGQTGDDHCFEDALQYVIGMLEQEPILGKIRAEIEPKCDRINSLASVLPYTAHREIQELLCEIIDLCKAESEIDNGND